MNDLQWKAFVQVSEHNAVVENARYGVSMIVHIVQTILIVILLLR